MPDWGGERQGKSLPHDTAKMWQWTKQTQSHIIGLVKMRCWTLNAAHCGTSVQNKEGIIQNIQYTGLFSKVRYTNNNNNNNAHQNIIYILAWFWVDNFEF